MRRHALCNVPALALAAISFVGACSSVAKTDTTATENPETTGTVSFDLRTGSGSITVVNYAISDGSQGHTYDGDLPVGDASVLAAAIGGIQAGGNYQLTLAATEADGVTPCSGHAGPFTVVAHTSVLVPITLTCKRPATTGTVVINGTTNLCAQIDSITADVSVNGVISLQGAADDPDNGPEPITYTWTTDSGSLSDTASPNPTLTCVADGPVTLSLTVTDGDPAEGCADTFAFTLACNTGDGTGTVIIDAGPTTNLCPKIDALTADPPVNGSIALHGTAEDPDGDALTYLWTTDRGTLDDPTAPDTTLLCAGSGPANLTLTVSDGDNSPGCPDTFSLMVSCP